MVAGGMGLLEGAVDKHAGRAQLRRATLAGAPVRAGEPVGLDGLAEQPGKFAAVGAQDVDAELAGPLDGHESRIGQIQADRAEAPARATPNRRR